MGISNVTQQYKIDFAKLASGKKAGSASNSRKPEYLQMTGSIFSAPGLNKSTSTKGTLTGENIRKAIGEFSRPANGKSSTAGKDSSSMDFSDIDSVSGGKAAISKMSGFTSQVKAVTRKTQANAKTASALSSEAQKKQQASEAEDKKFQSQYTRQQSELKRDQQKMARMIRDIETTQREVDDMQNELNSLSASNSFSIGNSGSGSARAKELQTLIGSKVGVLQQNGKQVYSLQRTTNRTIKSMQSTNKRYVNTQKANQKTVQTQQAETNTIIEGVAKAEPIIQIVAMGGQAISLAGDGLIALGSASSVAAGLGAALVATGGVMKKIGSAAQLACQYAQTAVNLTKGVAYAAEGNLQGAMQSFVAAAQTGAACVKGSMEIKGEFGKIDAQAKAATDKIAANDIAKQKAAKLSEEGKLGGMTEKEARKAISSNLQEQFAKGDIDGVTKTHDMNGRLKQLREAANKSRTDVSVTGTLDGGDLDVTVMNTSMVADAAAKAKTDFSNAVKDAGGSIDEKGVVTLADDKRKGISKNASKGFKASSATKTAGKTANKTSNPSNWADKLNKGMAAFSSVASMGTSVYKQFSGNYGMNGMNGMYDYQTAARKQQTLQRNRELAKKYSHSSRRSLRKSARA